MNNRHYAQSFEGVQSFMYRVFGWMSYALALTGFTAYYIAQTPSISNIIWRSGWSLLLLIIAQFVIVIALSAAIQRNSISYGTAFVLFTLYSVLTGATLSGLFFVFTTGSLATTFFITAGMFASMALYGAITKADLTSMGSILYMALVGIIISLFINVFVRSSMFDLIISCIGVIVFAGLTAYDVQKITNLAKQTDITETQFGRNIAILAALQLYLDFVNLFINLLHILGQRREQ